MIFSSASFTFTKSNMIQIKRLIATILFVFITFTSYGQEVVPPSPGAPPQGPPPPGLPIDSALISLLVVGILYGTYKAIKFSKIKKA